MEPGETPAAAVEREVGEETGLAVRAVEQVGRVRIAGPAVVYQVVDFSCTLLAPGQQPVAGDDAANVRFADGEDLARLPCTPGLLETLRAWGVALPS